MQAFRIWTLPTPCGELGVSLAVGGRVVDQAPTRSRRSSSGQLILLDWNRFNGASVKFCVAKLGGMTVVTDSFGETIRVEAQWGAVATFTAVEDCGPLELRAELPESCVGRWATGEELAARNYHHGATELFVGGGDGDFFDRAIRAGRYPARWAEIMVPDVAETVFGATDALGDFPEPSAPSLPPSLHGIGWMLPPLEAGETAVIHLAVAWDHRPFAYLAAEFAVDLLLPQIDVLIAQTSGE